MITFTNVFVKEKKLELLPHCDLAGKKSTYSNPSNEYLEYIPHQTSFLVHCTSDT